MPYSLYTPENIKTCNVKISKVLPLLEPWEFKQFMKNINKWNLRREIILLTLLSIHVYTANLIVKCYSKVIAYFMVGFSTNYTLM